MARTLILLVIIILCVAAGARGEAKPEERPHIDVVFAIGCQRRVLISRRRRFRRVWHAGVANEGRRNDQRGRRARLHSHVVVG